MQINAHLFNTQSVVLVRWMEGQLCGRRNKQNSWIICRPVVNLQCIVPLHAQQTTADLHSAVGGTCIGHLVTIDATRTKIDE